MLTISPTAIHRLGCDVVVAGLSDAAAFARATADKVVALSTIGADAQQSNLLNVLGPMEEAFASLPMAGELPAHGLVGRAAALLLQESWEGKRVVELEGPQRVSPNDLAAAFANVLGTPVRSEAVPRDRWEPIFRTQGMKNPTPRMQMIDGFSAGWIDFPDHGAHAAQGLHRHRSGHRHARAERTRMNPLSTLLC